MSNRIDARKETFEEVTVLGKSMLFTCLRVDKSSVPKGLFMYEVRHDDYGRGDPCQIGEWIMVNHWGTLISNEELELVPDKRLNNAYLNIDPEKDWNYEGVSRTLREYMGAHPPQKNKNREFER